MFVSAILGLQAKGSEHSFTDRTQEAGSESLCENVCALGRNIRLLAPARPTSRLSKFRKIFTGKFLAATKLFTVGCGGANPDSPPPL